MHFTAENKLTCRRHLYLQISGIICNTGHSVIFTADNDTVSTSTSPQIPVNITGGPLSYRYRFEEIHIHYGLHDQFGSEHSVEAYTFPAEVRPLFLLFDDEYAVVLTNQFLVSCLLPDTNIWL